MKNINLFLITLLFGGFSNVVFGEIVIPPDAPVESVKTPVPEEDGVLSPKKRETLNDNPDKAPNYILQQRDSVLFVVPVTNIPGTHVPLDNQYKYEHEINSRNTLERNRDRARGYSQNSQSATKTRMASGVMGKDGIAVFPCTNTTGSINHDGENFKSGSVFFINLNGKSVKARCH